jgi:hypothetical protein
MKARIQARVHHAIHVGDHRSGTLPVEHRLTGVALLEEAEIVHPRDLEMTREIFGDETGVVVRPRHADLKRFKRAHQHPTRIRIELRANGAAPAALSRERQRASGCRVRWRMTISFARHQFPPDIIRHAVWLYLRFTLSYRDVEDLLPERGLDISYETVRRWVLKFGPLFARELRRRRPSCDTRRQPIDIIGGFRRGDGANAEGGGDRANTRQTP